MRWYFKLLIGVILASFILGMAWREAKIRQYPPSVRYHQKIMQKISTNEYLEELQNYTDFGRAIDFTRKDYHQLLLFLGLNVEYTEEYILRHEDPIEILKYGRGRCGEFAIAFTALCLANAWEARLVVDNSEGISPSGKRNGDHVWTEIWNGEEWIHIDPTEGARWAKKNPDNIYSNPFVNNPYMYERDWGKELTEVWGIETYSVERVEENYRYE